MHIDSLTSNGCCTSSTWTLNVKHIAMSKRWLLLCVWCDVFNALPHAKFNAQFIVHTKYSAHGILVATRKGELPSHHQRAQLSNVIRFVAHTEKKTPSTTTIVRVCVRKVHTVPFLRAQRIGHIFFSSLCPITQLRFSHERTKRDIKFRATRNNNKKHGVRCTLYAVQVHYQRKNCMFDIRTCMTNSDALR